ncbi:cytochrome bd oxidase small subunit CydS [Paenibacillus sp. 1P03SA]
MEHFMIMYAPPIVVAISLLFLFLWAPRTKDVTDEPESEQGRRMR